MQLWERAKVDFLKLFGKGLSQRLTEVRPVLPKSTPGGGAAIS
jgi:hypothetical protein